MIFLTHTIKMDVFQIEAGSEEEITDSITIHDLIFALKIKITEM